MLMLALGLTLLRWGWRVQQSGTCNLYRVFRLITWAVSLPLLSILLGGFFSWAYHVLSVPLVVPEALTGICRALFSSCLAFRSPRSILHSSSRKYNAFNERGSWDVFYR